MLVRVSQSPGKMARSDELTREGVLWNEVTYRRGSEIFGEAEPSHYMYQIIEGAVFGRTSFFQTTAARLTRFTCRVMFSA